MPTVQSCRGIVNGHWEPAESRAMLFGRLRNGIQKLTIGRFGTSAQRRPAKPKPSVATGKMPPPE